MYICICNRMTESDIRDAVKNGEDVEEMIGDCGACLIMAREIIEESEE